MKGQRRAQRPLCAEQCQHLRDTLLAEFDLLLAAGLVDDDAGDAHRAILVLELGEVRDVVGFGTHVRVQRRDALRGQYGSGHIVQVSETRIITSIGVSMASARALRSSSRGWPGPAALYRPSTNELNS